jgi:hypothetical protein
MTAFTRSGEPDMFRTHRMIDVPIVGTGAPAR